MLIIRKERATLIKGILICMMVFLHLFNGNNTNNCTNLLYVGDIPFAKWLSNACWPVAFFLLLSGYGLAYTYDNKGITITQQLKRIYKLFVHYWITLILFVPIGYFVGLKQYPGSFMVFIQNFFGWTYTYNGETWFLFPYCLINIFCLWIIKFISKIGNKKAIIITSIIQIITCFTISRYGEKYLFNNMILYRPLQFFHFLYPFTIGITLYLTKKNMNTSLPSWLAFLLLLLVISFTATFGNSLTYMLYVPIMTFLFCHINFPNWIRKLLKELGDKSMSIWMIHTWFCYYLFRNEIYSLQYPLLIFLVTMTISYLTSLLVMWIAKYILSFNFLKCIK